MSFLQKYQSAASAAHQEHKNVVRSGLGGGTPSGVGLLLVQGLPGLESDRAPPIPGRGCGCRNWWTGAPWGHKTASNQDSNTPLTQKTQTGGQELPQDTKTRTGAPWGHKTASNQDSNTPLTQKTQTGGQELPQDTKTHPHDRPQGAYIT